MGSFYLYVLPLLNAAVWLTPTARVSCSNAVNIGESKTWVARDKQLIKSAIQIRRWHQDMSIQRDILTLQTSMRERHHLLTAKERIDSTVRHSHVTQSASSLVDGHLYQQDAVVAVSCSSTSAGQTSGTGCRDRGSGSPPLSTDWDHCRYRHGYGQFFLDGLDHNTRSWLDVHTNVCVYACSTVAHPGFHFGDYKFN